MRTLLSIVIAIFISTFEAKAYTVAKLDQGEFRTDAVTDVFIVGYGREMGRAFLFSAIARARKIKEIYPHHQVLFADCRFLLATSGSYFDDGAYSLAHRRAGRV